MISFQRGRMELLIRAQGSDMPISMMFSVWSRNLLLLLSTREAANPRGATKAPSERRTRSFHFRRTSLLLRNHTSKRLNQRPQRFSHFLSNHFRSTDYVRKCPKVCSSVGMVLDLVPTLLLRRHSVLATVYH